jgi:methylenetetrahydrofolate dehydrogenase (NADP+) / methenyltetrahydrofolate cyclohydrolase
MAVAKVIDGKEIAAALARRITDAAAALRTQTGAAPGLAAILVGNDPSSAIYVRAKDRAAAAAGFVPLTRRFAADFPESALILEVERLGRDERVDGIVVQLPLPPQIDSRRVIAALDPAKDVDGFHPLNVGRLWSGEKGFVPATAEGCLRLLRTVHTDLKGLAAVILGRSNLVGKPLAALLLGADCTVTIAHSKTREAAQICRRADILVAAVGRPRLVGPGWIKPGATVIDVGINRIALEGGRKGIVGDVDYLPARAIAGAITPVPGGVGPMTIACLMANTLLAACRRRGLPDPLL